MAIVPRGQREGKTKMRLVKCSRYGTPHQATTQTKHKLKQSPLNDHCSDCGGSNLGMIDCSADELYYNQRVEYIRLPEGWEE